MLHHNLFVLRFVFVCMVVVAPCFGMQQMLPATQERASLPYTDQRAPACHVRVLLADAQLPEQPVVWRVTSSNGFFLADDLHTKPLISTTLTAMDITWREGCWYLNNKKVVKQRVVLRAQDGNLMFNGKEYHGSFSLHADAQRCLLINTLPIEEYVFSVLKSEGWPGWPHEMNKVLAITCRTYVTAMIKEARESKRAYDVKNTNAHQTYQGVHVQHDLKKAVDDTRGIFLSYEGKPILAMFDICCGGVVPAGIHGFNFDKAPYLARDYACTYCKECSSYSWHVSFDKRDLVGYLQKEYPQLKTLKDVKITKKDKAGLVQEAVVKGAKSPITLSGRKLYTTFKDIKSYCFGVSKKGGLFTFSGRGFGHHLGLCQWGARAMVREGWNYRSILSFYYPQTKLMRLVA